MSRSGYSDDYDNNWQLIKWRGQVASATKGRRGQAMLRDLLTALDAMPEKRLISESLADDENVCAIGALGRQRGIDMSKIDPEDQDTVAQTFGIARPLACEIMYENDEGSWYGETPEARWSRMREWVASQIKEGNRHELVPPTA